MSMKVGFNQSDVDQLEEIIDKLDPEGEALDYFAIHGLVCASVVGPARVEASTLVHMVLGYETEAANTEDTQHLKELLEKLANSVAETLSQEELVDIPEPDNADDEEYAMSNWCVGFVEGFMENENLWFADKEEQVAGLLLPIMALSDLFEDDDFSEIKSNENLVLQFIDQLPELITDIFLFYHASK